MKNFLKFVDSGHIFTYQVNDIIYITNLPCCIFFSALRISNKQEHYKQKTVKTKMTQKKKKNDCKRKNNAEKA